MSGTLLAGSRRLCAHCRSRVGQPVALLSIRPLASIAPPSSGRLGNGSSRPSARGPRQLSTSAVRSAPKVEASVKKRKVDMEQFPPERIRNLSIIAHIDHGKSTLADRLLQMTNTVPPSSSPQFLDKLKVERERGITVKAQTVSIIHTHTDGHKYLINLIDTPGHVDFSYEVSRSLGACEGGLLLVDSTQGIQAQTLSVFHHALEADLELLAVINKVDLPHAAPAETSAQIASSLGLPEDKHMHISAKSGMGVDTVLNQIVEGLPPPAAWEVDDGKLRGLVFDHFYDHFRGVVSLVRLFSGTVKKGDKIRFLQSDRKYEVLEVGIQNPEEALVDALQEGQVGYVVCNMKNSEDAYIGDTICWADKLVEPLPGFQPMKAMVYAGVFPIDAGEFPKLEEAIERVRGYQYVAFARKANVQLTLNDRSVTVQRESSAALSQGFRLGFLGTLHMDVFRQRLEDEYDSNVIVTAPTVPYKVRTRDGKETFISNPADFPDVTDPKSRVAGVEEPMVHATIFVPNEYIGEMMDLCSRYRGVQQEYRLLENSERAILKYTLPLAEIVTDFFSDLKSASSGFASFDYEEAGYEASDLVKLNMMLNGKPVDALAMIVHRSAAQSIGRAWTKKLRDVLPRQLFEVAIQAAIGTRVVARETLSAVRKDVTAGLYGGHYERKLKHLNKQKEGKKRLKKLAGNIDIPQSAFFDVLASRPRAFSTSARRPAPVTARPLDLVTEYLPDDLAPPSIDLSSPDHTAPGHSLYTPAPLTPQQSADLSELHRLLDQKPVDSPAIIRIFDRLTRNAELTRILTPPELTGILRALVIVERNDRYKAMKRQQTIGDVQNELSALTLYANKGVEHALLASMQDQANKSSVNLEEMESRMSTLFQRVPDPTDVLGVKRYRLCVHYLLRLYATAGNVERFEVWRQRLVAAGVDDDSHSGLARLMLATNTGDDATVSSTLGELFESVVDPRDQIVLVNYALWSQAIRANWPVIVATYRQLAPHAPTLDIPTSTDARPLPVPAGLRPSSQTFSLLLHAFSRHGFFNAAVGVFSSMTDHGHQPHVPDYISLFKGFGRHGVVPPVKAGRLASSFPLFETFDTPSASSDQALSRGQSISQIWQNSVSGLNRPATPGEAAWTEDNLQEIFTSFLKLSPSDGKNQAPTPVQTWSVLLAFARTTNGNDDVLRSVWDRLQGKFEQQEGWWGWRLDGRLRRLRKSMDEVDSVTEQL